MLLVLVLALVLVLCCAGVAGVAGVAGAGAGAGAGTAAGRWCWCCCWWEAAISAGPTFIWTLMASPKRSETGLKLSETVGKAAIFADPTKM